jgi:secondary thiamine-phosphate synthase enzyme
MSDGQSRIHTSGSTRRVLHGRFYIAGSTRQVLHAGFGWWRIFDPVIKTTTHRVATKGQGDAHDLTQIVRKAVAGMRRGIATVFVVGSTAGITTIEFEPGAVADFNRLFEKLAPRSAEYQHHLRWGDDNGSSHVRAALLGPSLTVPFDNGALLLGTWQQIMLLEFDTSPRDREIVIQVVGE